MAVSTPNGDSSSFVCLLAQARKGDDDAVGRLLERFRHYLLKIAAKEMNAGLLRKAGASDLVQESIIEARGCLHQFREDSGPRLAAWLRTILLKNIQDFVKAANAEKRAIDKEKPLAGASVVADEKLETPCTQAQKKEQLDAFAAAFKRLSPRQQEILRLYQEGWTFARIGAHVGVTGDAIGKAWAGAIEELRQMLAATLGSGV